MILSIHCYQITHRVSIAFQTVSIVSFSDFVDMVFELQEDCDSTLHIVTETVGKLQKCPSAFPESVHLCQLCQLWSDEDICGRCCFVIREDTVGLLSRFVEEKK